MLLTDPEAVCSSGVFRLAGGGRLVVNDDGVHLAAFTTAFRKVLDGVRPVLALLRITFDNFRVA